jgi:hypothetical protein
MSAADIAEAMRRVTSGDQSPPRPWAYLSGLGIIWVGEAAYLEVAGFTDQAGFDITTDDGAQYRVMVRRVA